MTFTDTSIGITPEEMPQAMAPFFTTKEQGKGWLKTGSLTVHHARAPWHD
jgi:signal transduction histidine kinase